MQSFLPGQVIPSSIQARLPSNGRAAGHNIRPQATAEARPCAPAPLCQHRSPYTRSETPTPSDGQGAVNRPDGGAHRRPTHRPPTHRRPTVTVRETAGGRPRRSRAQPGRRGLCYCATATLTWLASRLLCRREPFFCDALVPFAPDSLPIPRSSA